VLLIQWLLKGQVHRACCLHLLMAANAAWKPIYLLESRALTTLHDLHTINCMVNDLSEQLAAILLGFADPSRRAILVRLAHGESSGTELAQPFSISAPAVSKHVRVLEHADRTLHRKGERTQRFRFAARPMREAAAWLEHERHFWEAQINSLETYLLTTSEKEQDVDDPSSPT
jgi:DNA-binding transcriptional ArsR family regulator